MKLVTDVDAAQAKRIFEILYEDSDIFQGFSLAEVDAMSAIFKLLSFKK